MPPISGWKARRPPGPSVARDLQALLGRDDGVGAAGAQLRGVGGLAVHGLVAHRFRHPAAVAVGLVQRVRRDARPGPVGILGEVQEHRPHALLAPGHLAQTLALGAVYRVQLGHRGVEAAGDARGASGRGRAGATEDDRRVGSLQRPRRDVHVTAAEREALTAPGLLHRLDAFLDQAPAILQLDAEHAELRGEVAAGHGHLGAAAADDVEYREVLGDADRVVEGQDQRLHADAHALRARGRGGRQHQWRGQVAVVVAVVLGQHQRAEAVAISPGDLLQGGGVELLDARTGLRRAHVVLQDEIAHPITTVR